MNYDRRVPARKKRKVYKIVVKPAMLYFLETTVLTKTRCGVEGSTVEGAAIFILQHLQIFHYILVSLSGMKLLTDGNSAKIFHAYQK